MVLHEQWFFKTNAFFIIAAIGYHEKTAIREKADIAYRSNAKRMCLKHLKQCQVEVFTVGQSVSVRIPRIDRASTVLQRLPCVVVQQVGKAQAMYRLRCQSGVLKHCYTASDLEPYSGSYDMSPDNWEKLPRVTLREAARNQAPWNVFQGNK